MLILEACFTLCSCIAECNHGSGGHYLEFTTLPVPVKTYRVLDIYPLPAGQTQTQQDQEPEKNKG